MQWCSIFWGFTGQPFKKASACDCRLTVISIAVGPESNIYTHQNDDITIKTITKLSISQVESINLSQNQTLLLFNSR